MVELVPDRDDPRALTVMINGVPSSFIDLDDPRNVGFEYMDIMCAVLDHTRTGALDVVHLGAAGCAMARSIDATRPGSRQIGIDIDARLIDLARTWFDLPRSPRLRLRAGDARAQLATLATASADVVIRDVFAGDTTPAHLLTQEFVADVLRVLRPGGIYLVNCADRPPLDGARAEVATLRAALEAARPPVEDVTIPGEVGIISEPALLKSRRYYEAAQSATAEGCEDPAAAMTTATSCSCSSLRRRAPTRSSQGPTACSARRAWRAHCAPWPCRRRSCTPRPRRRSSPARPGCSMTP